MTLWLVIGGTSRGNARHDLSIEPSPAMMADGIGGVCRRGWQYWIEDDGIERERES